MRNLNTTQRIIIAIIAPIAIILIVYGIMSYLDNEGLLGWWPDSSPLELEESWIGWLIALLIIGVFETFWFGKK